MQPVKGYSYEAYTSFANTEDIYSVKGEEGLLSKAKAAWLHAKIVTLEFELATVFVAYDADKDAVALRKAATSLKCQLTSAVNDVDPSADPVAQLVPGLATRLQKALLGK